MDPREHGRPLDARESQAFDDIVAAFGEPLSAVVPAPGPAVPGPPVPARPRVTGRQAVLVLAVAVVVAAFTAVLPAPVNLWAPVVLFAAIALGSVVWGRREEGRRD